MAAHSESGVRTPGQALEARDRVSARLYRWIRKRWFTLSVASGGCTGDFKQSVAIEIQGTGPHEIAAAIDFPPSGRCAQTNVACRLVERSRTQQVETASETSGISMRLETGHGS